MKQKLPRGQYSTGFTFLRYSGRVKLKTSKIGIVITTSPRARYLEVRITGLSDVPKKRKPMSQ
jgi:hypothetical protein